MLPSLRVGIDAMFNRLIEVKHDQAQSPRSYSFAESWFPLSRGKF
jgi:hypothetical protein